MEGRLAARKQLQPPIGVESLPRQFELNDRFPCDRRVGRIGRRQGDADEVVRSESNRQRIPGPQAEKANTRSVDIHAIGDDGAIGCQPYGRHKDTIREHVKPIMASGRYCYHRGGRQRGGGQCKKADKTGDSGSGPFREPREHPTSNIP